MSTFEISIAKEVEKITYAKKIADRLRIDLDHQPTMDDVWRRCTCEWDTIWLPRRQPSSIFHIKKEYTVRSNKQDPEENVWGGYALRSKVWLDIMQVYAYRWTILGYRTDIANIDAESARRYSILQQAADQIGDLLYYVVLLCCKDAKGHFVPNQISKLKPLLEQLPTYDDYVTLDPHSSVCPSFPIAPQLRTEVALVWDRLNS